MSAKHDPGLHAVARVRGVRETDSRLGLQQALAEQRQRELSLASLEDRLRNAPAFEIGTATAFIAQRQALATLGQWVTTAGEEVASARTITGEARVRWQQDKTRLSAVEMLLERRAAERRAERDRAEARDLDEVAAQLWQRTRGGETS